ISTRSIPSVVTLALSSNHAARAALYTLPLHDALPILWCRVRDLTDRRRITLALTSKASENLERVREEWRRTVSGADIDPDDLDAAFRVLSAIDSWIGKGASSS